MLTTATVATLRMLWLDVTPVIEKNLADVMAALVDAEDWPTARALQASAKTLQGFLKLPDNLARRLELGLDGVKEPTYGG